MQVRVDFSHQQLNPVVELLEDFIKTDFDFAQSLTSIHQMNILTESDHLNCRRSWTEVRFTLFPEDSQQLQVLFTMFGI